MRACAFSAVVCWLCAIPGLCAAGDGRVALGEAFARWGERELTVGNSLFEASFQMRCGILQPLFLRTGGEELLRAADGAEGDAIGVAAAEPGWSAAGEIRQGRQGGIEGPYVDRVSSSGGRAVFGIIRA